MTISIWQKARRQRTLSYDVVVVGGGLIGTSTAYWLGRQQPSLRVALLEARTLGAGASGRSAGFVLQGADADYLTTVDRYGERTARRLWHFTEANRDLLASELRGSAFGWRSDGSLTVAGGPEEEEQLRAGVSFLRAAGASVVFRDADEVNDQLQASDFYGGLYVTSGAVVNPLRLVHHLAEASRADVRTQQPVERIQWHDDGVVLDTPNLRVRAQQAVLALGPSLPTLMPALADLIRPVRAQMLATAPAETTHVSVPVYSHGGHYYLRQQEEGTLLVGGGRHQHRTAEETREDVTTPAVQATIERYLHTHFPWSQSLPIRQRWSGIMAFSADGRPIVGRVPEHPRSLFATGFTGHGFSYGFRMGRLLANLAGGTSSPKELDLFAASRFEEWTAP